MRRRLRAILLVALAAAPGCRNGTQDPAVDALLLPDVVEGGIVALAAGTDGAYGPWAPGVWALYAEPGSHADQMKHAIVSCRDVSIESDRKAAVATFERPVWIPVAQVSRPGFDVVRSDDAGAAMHVGITERGERIVSVLIPGHPERAAAVAAEVLGSAGGCGSAIAAVGDLTEYPLRHQRRLDAPIGPFGIRRQSWDGYSLTQSTDDELSVIYGFISLRLGREPVPDDLVEFWAPSSASLGWTSTDGDRTLRASTDRTEDRFWIDGEWLRLAYRVGGDSARLDDLVDSLHSERDGEWAALVDAAVYGG